MNDHPPLDAALTHVAFHHMQTHSVDRVSDVIAQVVSRDARHLVAKSTAASPGDVL